MSTHDPEAAKTLDALASDQKVMLRLGGVLAWQPPPKMTIEEYAAHVVRCLADIVRDPDIDKVCRNCGRSWRPVQRAQCLFCGDDSGPE